MSPCFHQAFLGVLFADLRIHGASSLKDRRQVVRSMVERLRKKWNISVADMGPDGSWTDVRLAVGTLGSSQGSVLSRLEEIESYLRKREEESDFYIVSIHREVDCYDALPD